MIAYHVPGGWCIAREIWTRTEHGNECDYDLAPDIDPTTYPTKEACDAAIAQAQKG